MNAIRFFEVFFWLAVTLLGVAQCQNCIRMVDCDKPESSGILFGIQGPKGQPGEVGTKGLQGFQGSTGFGCDELRQKYNELQDKIIRMEAVMNKITRKNTGGEKNNVPNKTTRYRIKRLNVKGTYDEVLEECTKLGGNFISNTLAPSYNGRNYNKQIVNFVNQKLWIGRRDSVPNTNETNQYTWAASEPSAAGECVVLDRSDQDEEVHMFVADCGDKFKCLCEIAV